MIRYFLLMRFISAYPGQLKNASEINDFHEWGIPRDVLIRKFQLSKKSFPPVLFWFPKKVRSLFLKCLYAQQDKTEHFNDYCQKTFNRLGALHRIRIQDLISDCINQENGYLQVTDRLDPVSILSDRITGLKLTAKGRDFSSFGGFLNIYLNKREKVFIFSIGLVSSEIVRFLYSLFS